MNLSKKEFLVNLECFQGFINLSLEEKVEHSRELIREALDMAERPALACSWGKDSFLMLKLVLEQKPDIPVVFCNTGIEFPETYAFRDRIIKEYDLNYTELKPERTFWDIVKEYDYPAQSRYNKIKQNHKGAPMCCYLLKEKPAEDWYKENGVDLVFVGLNYDEGMLRRTKIIESGGLYYVKSVKRAKCLPICYWSEQQIFQYHFENDLPLNEGYKHSPRIGCMPCTGHIGWEKQMAKSNFKMYRKVARDIGKPVLEDWMGA